MGGWEQKSATAPPQHVDLILCSCSCLTLTQNTICIADGATVQERLRSAFAESVHCSHFEVLSSGLIS